jgi:hypothetical protein
VIAPYREAPPPLPRPHAWRFLRGLTRYLYPVLANYRLFRRWYGGKWALRWVESCWSSLWLPVDDFEKRLPLEGANEAVEEWP